MTKVAVGMSGGVDSSVAAAILKELGYEVTGFFIEAYNEPGCRTNEDKKDALKAAIKVGIPFQVLDVRKEYKQKVVDYFLNTYREGRTPNPDVVCNREVKFGIFYDWAIAHGFERVATGHYARISERETPKSEIGSLSGVALPRRQAGRKVRYLTRAVDSTKDQSYFLWQVPQEHLSNIIFPLGAMMKKEVRARAMELGLANADKPDSMGICMMGEFSVREFLKEKLGENPGEVLLEQHVVGSHRGLWFHTIGQRGGFQIEKQTLKKLGYHPETMEPLYVIGKDVTKNQLTVGFRKDASRREFGISNSELRITDKEIQNLCKRVKLYVRIRNLGELITVTHCESDSDKHVIQISTQEPVFGVAEGQAAVIYSRTGEEGEEIVVGGGEISVY